MTEWGLLVIILGFSALAGWLRWHGSEKLVRSLKEHLSDQRGINGQLNEINRRQKEVIEAPNAAEAMLLKVHEQLAAERRSNASLRGALTKRANKK